MKKELIIMLYSIKGVGGISLLKLLLTPQMQNIQTLQELKKVDFSKVVKDDLAQFIKQNCTNKNYKKAKEMLEYCKKNQIEVISYFDKEYPQKLKDGTNPPPLLFAKGDISLLHTQTIAVIGTRKATPIGKENAKKTTNFLAKSGYTILSGLAFGIDKIAHKETLRLNKQTIAVLPLIDTIYPKQNKDLVDEILQKGGLLVSENMPNTPFRSYQLVQRDRIQSALSDSVFVIETTKDGGSMYATLDAIKHKKDVYIPDIKKLHTIYQNAPQVEGLKFLKKQYQIKSYDVNDIENILSHLKVSL